MAELKPLRWSQIVLRYDDPERGVYPEWLGSVTMPAVLTGRELGATPPEPGMSMFAWLCRELPFKIKVVHRNWERDTYTVAPEL